jgi:hypothetical protein
MKCSFPTIYSLPEIISSSEQDKKATVSKQLPDVIDTFEKQAMLQLPPDLIPIVTLLSSSKGYKELFHNLQKAVMQTKGFHKVESSKPNVFNYGSYKVLPAIIQNSAIESENLLKVQPLHLACAPELIAHFKAGADESVLITKGNGNLVPYSKLKDRVPAEKKKQFLADIKSLLKHNLHHPYANRGIAEWYINKETGNIILDVWFPLCSIQEPQAKQEILETVEHLLEL